MNVYFIGGSPGSGKSTIAKMLAKNFNLSYYKLDDYLFKYSKKAAREGRTHSLLAKSLNAEQTWMREPRVQADEEIGIYTEIFQYALNDIEKMGSRKTIIAEGAGFLPQLMVEQNITPSRYICIVPTEDFQRSVFAKRTFLKLFLWGCKNKEAAFENWMTRDVLFAKEVLQQAKLLDYTSILVDGEKTITDNYHVVAKQFRFAQ